MAFDARDYHDIMSTKVEDLPDGPPTLKGGHYYGVVTRYEIGQTPWNTETQALFYHVQLTEPGEDVSEEDLNGIDLSTLTMNPIAYELVPSRMHTIKNLLKSLPSVNQSLSLDANVPEVVGARVLTTVTARPSKREGDSRMFNNISFMVGAPR